MTDFVIVAAAVAALAGPVAPGASSAGSNAAALPSASAPMGSPTVGFRTYPDATSCEQAAATMTARPGARLVCVPVEPLAGDMSAAY